MQLFHKKENIRIRPFEEWHAAMAYTPDEPAIHWINATGLLILELCAGKGASRDEIVRSLSEIMPARASRVPQLVDEALAGLEQKGIVQRRVADAIHAEGR